MSGFFTLDGNCNKDHQDQDHHHQPTDNNNSSLFLFKNEEIYNKGFELWQQYYQLHQQRQNHHQDVDFSVGPPSRRNNNSSDNNIIFNGNNNNGGGGGGDDQSSSYNSDRSAAGFRVMRQGRSGGNESINCQDCGNQAKKDCAHLRCRTCCKSRGFHCQTHVKSTWVPAAKRRERQQQLSTMLQTDQLDDAGRGENLKRMRENPGCSGGGGRGSALACTNSRLPATTTGFELGHFPAEVNSPAVFRCVRVSSADDAGEHLAYQTAVNIGGHVFKGILYHQGPESRPQSGGDIPSGFGGSQQPQHQPFHLTASTAGHNLNTTTTMLDPSIYPTAPLNAFMAGTQFFPPPTTHFRSTSS